VRDGCLVSSHVALHLRHVCALPAVTPVGL